MKGFVEVPLLDMIEQFGESKVKEKLSDFSCPKNKDVEYFLKHRAIDFSKQSITQTQLVFLSYKDEIRLAGYYSLTNKFISVKEEGLSNSLKKRIGKFGTRDTTSKGYHLSAPLIAQLGKNYTDDLNKQITGADLLQMAINKVKIAQVILGGKVVYIECEDTPRLLEFYKQNGFIIFGKREKDSEDADRVKGSHLMQLLKYLK